MTLNLKTRDPVVITGEYESYSYEIYDPNSTTAMVKIFLPEGGCVKAIPGCMFATSGNITIEGKLKKGMRARLGPDTARHQVMTATEGPGWVMLSPGFYGSVSAMHIDDKEMCVGDDAFLASIGEVESRAESQSTKKAFFSGHGLYVKHVKGTGVIFVCAVGSMASLTLAEEETVIVDTKHLVTWPAEGMKYEIQKASKGWFGTGLSGEGYVSRLTGPAEINVQTRNPEEMAEWIYDTKMPPAS